MRNRSRFERFRWLLALGSFVASCAIASSAAPKPQATPRPDAAEKLVSDLTGWLKLDSAQQAKTRVFARDMIARNEAIMERWQKTNKTHPEELNASRGQFHQDLLSILTPEQKKVYADTMMRVMAKGRSVPTRIPVPTRPPS
jgi:Spy/CpxP family protein refolding chaperone